MDKLNTPLNKETNFLPTRNQHTDNCYTRIYKQFKKLTPQKQGGGLVVENLNIDLEETEQETLLAIYQLDKIKKKLLEVASENPLDKKINISEEVANIQLKDKNKVIRVRPMSYT